MALRGTHRDRPSGPGVLGGQGQALGGPDSHAWEMVLPTCEKQPGVNARLPGAISCSECVGHHFPSEASHQFPNLLGRQISFLDYVLLA